MVASLVLIAALSAASVEKIDCGKVRWFVQTYGQSQAYTIARGWGYSNDQIIRTYKRCLRQKIEL